MGLILGLLTAPVTWPLAPVRGAIWVAEQIEREAEKQWSDPALIEAQLEDVAARRAAGELTDAEADQLEEELIARLLNPGVADG